VAIGALPHCHWIDGGLLDLVAIGARCREVGSALVVDATQSLGALPLDLAAVRPDYLVRPDYKWLLGPYSLGYLYVAETAFSRGAGPGRSRSRACPSRDWP
jgi:selenocysteine lyase/cysteine desulfurase